MDKNKNKKINMKSYADAGYNDDYHGGSYYHDYDDDNYSDDDNDNHEFHGGRFNFIKSMKHLGNSMKNEGVKLGKDALKTGIDAGKQIAKSKLKNYAMDAAKGLVAASPEMEEAAPLLLMAAGMKKPRKKREVSQREKNRHELIRMLMKKYDCSLAEASKHIKEKNLKY
jgi:hypothetical protein